MNPYFNARTIRKGMLFGIVLWLGVAIAKGQSSWVVDKHKDGIMVYTRSEANSEFRSFKALATLEATPEDIIAVLKNANDYIDWYGYTAAAEVLKKEGMVQYNYVETRFPWPYKNRDMVYRMTLDTLDSKNVTINLQGIPDEVPVKEGIVRMKKAIGLIQLKPLGNYTELTYQFHSEPGDQLPVWLANRSLAELPYQTLVGLRRVLKDKQVNR